MKRRAHYIFTSTLIGLDASMICLAFFIAYSLRPRDATPNQVIQPFFFYFGMMGLNVLACVAVFFFYRLYHLYRGMSRLDELYQAFPAVSLSVITGTAFTAFVYRNELDYPRIMIVYFWIAAAVLISIGRFVHHTVRSSLYSRGWGEARVLIVGTGEEGKIGAGAAHAATIAPNVARTSTADSFVMTVYREENILAMRACQIK